MSASSSATLLQSFDLDALDREEGVVVLLDREGVIVWHNAAWLRFALENEGFAIAQHFSVGSRYLDGVSGPLRVYFAAMFSDVMVTQEPFEQDYECSSPLLFRRHHLRVLPIADQGLLVEHTPRVVHAHGAPELESDEREYRDSRGLVVQCSNCRRVHRVGDGWHWVGPWVSRPPANTSHGLCPACAGHYFASTRHARALARARAQRERGGSS